jgi:hypothetical protein
MGSGKGVGGGEGEGGGDGKERETGREVSPFKSQKATIGGSDFFGRREGITFCFGTGRYGSQATVAHCCSVSRPMRDMRIVRQMNK